MLQILIEMLMYFGKNQNQANFWGFHIIIIPLVIIDKKFNLITHKTNSLVHAQNKQEGQHS